MSGRGQRLICNAWRALGGSALYLEEMKPVRAALATAFKRRYTAGRTPAAIAGSLASNVRNSGGDASKITHVRRSTTSAQSEQPSNEDTSARQLGGWEVRPGGSISADTHEASKQPAPDRAVSMRKVLALRKPKPVFQSSCSGTWPSTAHDQRRTGA